MNLEQLLRENILRFGTKNLNENIKNKLLLEQDPDSELPDPIENPEDAELSYNKKSLGQRVKQTAKTVGNVAKKVVGTATLVAPLSKIIRNRLFKRYVTKNGIPTKEELNLIYFNKNKMGVFVKDNYWTDEEGYSFDVAWCQNFDTGDQNSFPKINKNQTRPVRSINQ